MESAPFINAYRTDSFREKLYDMKGINTYPGMGQTLMRHLREAAAHIHADKLYIFPYGIMVLHEVVVQSLV